ncbi:hypothetical protein CCOS865_02186 [Pseudomonas reidholzensis]|uniref:Uncharacterized protein n=1 Tax=Pseudomonas reidholzensis TaxID=1785162 RepID=A0A383RS72_9PSED|nr:hypothetical protein [Pseudomonas reidholzensis]SYX89920.1 hypothetical protein CCOS865_02186 [Pseudomonas reidholzensis]
MKLVGWKTGCPADSRVVQVLRQLDNGQRIQWKCRFHSFEERWATHDGIYIDGVLGWRDLK